MKHLSIYMLIVGAIFASCDRKKVVQVESEKEKENTVEVFNDSTGIFIEASKIDSMILISDNDMRRLIGKADFATLADAVSTAIYDTQLNSSGIMMKMQAPDYTVIIYYTGKSNDGNNWLKIWKENGRIKFKNKWFNLPADKNQIVGKLLNKYKEKSH